MATDDEATEALTLDVDTMILDYLVCKATRAAISERMAEATKAPSESCEPYLEMVNVFQPLFESRHGSASVPDHLAVKLQILTFTNLFSRRHRASEYLPSWETLESHRETMTEAQAKEWLRRDKEGHWAANMVETESQEHAFPSILETRRSMLDHMGIPPDSEIPDLDSSIALLDTVPGFMRICCKLPPPDRTNLLAMAPILLLHAALEQLLIYGQPVSDAIQRTLAWGWTGYQDPAGHLARMESEQKLVALHEASQAPNPPKEFKRLLQEHPYSDFETQLLLELNYLLDVIGTPILAQLERGQLDGMTAAETRSLMERLRISSSPNDIHTTAMPCS